MYRIFHRQRTGKYSRLRDPGGRARKLFALAATLALLLYASSAYGNVNLELRPATATVHPGDVVLIGLYAVSDNAQNQAVRGMQVILEWDPAVLALDTAQPLINNGPYSWLMSGFYSDSGADGLNNTWADGNAYYQAIGNFQALAWATPSGLLVTTFRFIALAHTPVTVLHIPASAGLHTHTSVFGQDVGTDVVGTLGSASLHILDWGLLALSVTPTGCCLAPGQNVILQLTVANLPEPINGVQTILAYDAVRLELLTVIRGDGVGSPWDEAAEVYQGVADGHLTYAIVIPGASTSANSVVATMTFRVTPSAPFGMASFSILAASEPLVTKLTLGEDATAILPYLGPAVATSQIVSKGDMNGDGLRDGADIQDFVRVLLSDAPTPTELCAADVNCDCVLTLEDVPMFVEGLLTGQWSCP